MRGPKGFLIKENTFLLACLFLLVILSVSTLFPITGEQDRNQLQPESNINKIIGNDQLIHYAAIYNWPGNGTQIDPIVIKDSLFDGQGSESALSIQQTNLHLLIEGCRFTGSTGEWIYENPKPAGLQLVSCANIKIISSISSGNLGNGIISYNCNNILYQECRISNNSNKGLYFSDCINTSVRDCIIEHNANYGVWYFGSGDTNNVMENCTIQGNHWDGVQTGGFNNLIVNCSFLENGDRGVRLSGSNNRVNNCSFTRNWEGDLKLDTDDGENFVCNNTFQEGGGILAPVNEYYSNSNPVATVEGNYIAGRPIIFLHDVSEYLFPKDPGQVILLGCRDLQISNLNFENAYCGLYIGGCEQITVKGCNFFNNTYSGISDEISTSTEISECVFKENRGYGVYSENSKNATVQRNYFFDNLDGGFHLNYASDHPVVLQDNVFRNDGVFFSHITPETKIINNSINGKALVFLIEEKGLQFSNTEYIGQFILFRCDQIQFKNIHFQNTNTPVILVASFNIQFLNCSFANSQRGIYSKGGLAGAWEFFWANRNKNIHIENCLFRNIRLTALTFLYTCEFKVINTIVEGENSSGLADKWEMWTYGFSIAKSEIGLISGCKISNFTIGIYIRSESHDHLITNCTFSQCHEWGIFLISMAWDNVITYNNFIGVGVADGTFSSEASAPQNTFNHNYWSESDHSDENNDGYADSPYLIDKGTTSERYQNNYDFYPLVRPSKYVFERLPIAEESSTTTSKSTEFNGLDSFFLALIGIIVVMRRRSK